jgi:flagellar hook protein FlgE
MGFSQALSGLKSAATNLDVIGNNIANSQTVGFKGSRTIFSDIYAGTQAGLGTQVADIQQDFSTGTLESTGRNLDIAVSGTGFLRMLDTTGQVVYSRNGQLHLSNEGFLLNAQGARLTGYPPGVNNGGTPTTIQVPAGAMAANATTAITAQLNLDGRVAVPTVTPFAQNDPNTYSYANNVTIYDSQGGQHNATLYFIKTADNTWNVRMARESDTAVNLGTLAFNSDGELSTPTNGTIGVSADFVMPTGNGAADIELVGGINFNGTTQFSDDFSLDALHQDGYTSGSLVDVAIDQQGNVIGTYSNEKTVELGTITLANFRSPEGLKSVGDNAWVETTESGQPLLGLAGTGLFGSVESGLVEASNVDLTRELINLIIAQRTYQANSQTIKVQDEVLQNAVNL